MYKFPSDFDSSVFVDRALEMICFNASQIYFHFSDHLSICAETDFFFQTPSKAISTITVPAIRSDLMQLLERKVSRALILDAETLVVAFGNGCSLRFAALPEFESYRITVGGETIIV